MFAELDFEREELDSETIAKQLRKWNKEFKEKHLDVDDPGKKMHAPGQWWRQRISRLAFELEAKAEEEWLENKEYNNFFQD